MNYDEQERYISYLNNQIDILEIEDESLYNEFLRIEIAAKYMNQLNANIKKHPVLYDEWIIFLKKADIEQPEWKKDYEPFSSVDLLKPLPLHLQLPKQLLISDLSESFDDETINKMPAEQKEIINQLSTKIDYFNNRARSIRMYKKIIYFSKDHADFYLNMQRKIIANPDIMQVWKIFLTMCKLSLDNIEGMN